MCRIITLVGVEHIRRMLLAFVFKISATPYFYPTRAREIFEISEFPDNTRVMMGIKRELFKSGFVKKRGQCAEHEFYWEIH